MLVFFTLVTGISQPRWWRPPHQHIHSSLCVTRIPLWQHRYLSLSLFLPIHCLVRYISFQHMRIHSVPYFFVNAIHIYILFYVAFQSNEKSAYSIEQSFPHEMSTVQFDLIQSNAIQSWILTKWAYQSVWSRRMPRYYNNNAKIKKRWRNTHLFVHRFTSDSEDHNV